MKIGVSTVPWGKTKRPRRAELVGSVERTVKDTEERREIGQILGSAKLNHSSLRHQKIVFFRNILFFTAFLS
jgi:hypothetical protein